MFALSRLFPIVFALLLFAGPVQAGEGNGPSPITPPRLSYIDGEVSFWRPGAEDWTQARVNLPIAAGDMLYTSDGANFELQIGSRNFVRADERTQLALVNHEPGFLQFQVTSGRVSFDLRQMPAGQTVELDTPHAVFTIAQSGYYRVDVDDETHFTTRRGGRATVIPDGGRAMVIQPAEQVVVSGNGSVRVETYVAPEPDRWDRWNYARTDELLEAVSARYVPPGVYGVYELDRYGSWRVVPRYGFVWVPDVPYGWVPYSTGRWIWDPYYEWTWVDDAPWGWAPFHYGRWVYIDGYWAWTPGPVTVRTVVYAPALVAFFWVGRDVSVRIGFGYPGVAWIALGWGEPVLPWWGHHGFRGRPWWGGWYGPRVVNNVVIKSTTVVNVTNIVYQNSFVRNAVVVTPGDHFGRHRPLLRTVDSVRVQEFERVHGALPVKPRPESLVASPEHGVRPPRFVLERPMVSTRPPAEARLPWRTERAKVREEESVRDEVAPRGREPLREQEERRARPQAPMMQEPPKPRLVSPPRRSDEVLPRPEFGTRGGEERPRPSLPPRYQEMRIPAAPAVREAPTRVEPMPPRAVTPGPAMPLPRPEREAVPPRPMRDIQHERPDESHVLPGHPANRLYRGIKTEDRGRGHSDDEPGDFRREPRGR